MSSVEDSPVRISAMPDSGPDSLEQKADSGTSSPESFASWHPGTLSWRTSQLCFDGEWATYSAPFPTSGTMRSGRVFRRATWEPRIDATGCSLLPTPSGTSNHGKNNVSGRLDEWGGS